MTGKSAAPAFDALDLKVSTVPLQHVLDDGQAKSGSATGTAAPGIDAIEAFGETRDVLGSDSYTGISH